MKKLIWALVLGCLLALAPAEKSEVNAMSSTREILNFNTGWLYSAQDYANAQLKLFDDSGFEAVSVPHANTRLTAHKGNDFQSQIESYRFVSWYRRHFTVGNGYEGKRLIVEFEGVATVADVYVNGAYAGSHKGAYTGFTIDITDYVSIGADNVIAVRVDSTKRSDIPPEGGDVDYCLFGGIVRDVKLLCLNSVYVENTFVSTPDLTAEGGSVKNETTVKNSSSEEITCRVETLIRTAEGDEIARSLSEEKTISAGKAEVFEAETEVIEKPQLWDVDNPYLYVAETRILEGASAVDSLETRMGFRFFEFRSENGDGNFYLNGKKLKLRGINRHEQWPWQGRAIPNKLQEADAEMIKEAGFNAVRCSHYPQDISFLNRCDELGLIVFEEAPGWQHIGDKAWQEVYKTNLCEMILRDRNHPSIVTWGVRVNESWDNRELYTQTTELSKALDPTRPTHGVRRNENYESTEMIEDILGANYQYPEVPRFTPFVSTEHSWECWTNGCGFPWATDTQAAAFTKSFADVVNYYYGNELCAGGFAWSMFDYNNEVNYTNTGHVFYSGIYDIFRHDKPVANFYRSQKSPSEEAVLYIANYWTEGSPRAVEVYSNCDEVELFVNGESKGRITPNLYLNVPHPAFSFENVEFEAGELTAVGYIGGEEAARAVRRTPEAAARLAAKADYTTLVADGSDMTSVTVELTDKNGTRLPYADNRVTISVEGPAEFIGETETTLEGGRTAFLLRSIHGAEGAIRCTVTADGVETAYCELEAAAFDEENVVPYSDTEAEIAPLAIYELNDTDSAFSYSGNWIGCWEKRAYKADNHYSSAAGDSVSVSFTGDALEWYGTKAPAHGIMAVSVDGGAESFVDCYAEERQDNVLLYATGSLGYGEHTVRVRVTGEGSASAEGVYINADRVRIFERSAVLKNRIIKESFEEWEKDSSFRSDGGSLYQEDNSFGDCTAFADGVFADCLVQAEITLPSGNDTGSGLLARETDGGRFYQLEIKGENGGLVWGIWRAEGSSWTLLASGPFVADGEKVHIRMELVGDTITAYSSADAEEWTALGACRDTAYQSGRIGLRTHNAAAVFSNFAAFEMSALSSDGCELCEAVVIDGEVRRVRFASAEGRVTAIAFSYGEDGVLASAASVPLDESGAAKIPAAKKLLVWESLKTLRPLGKEWEI